jgi:hypothetical protein
MSDSYQAVSIYASEITDQIRRVIVQTATL